MDVIRKFLIRYSKQLLGAAVALLLIVCILLTAVCSHNFGALTGLGLLALSVVLHKREKATDRTVSYILLGAAVYFFPASSAVVLFYVGKAFKIQNGRWRMLLIVVAEYVCGIPTVLRTGKIGFPVTRLVSWLNVNNLFDHNISFWSLVTGREQLRFGLVAVALASGLLILGFFFYEKNKMGEEFYMIWSVWTCLLFLPYGHAEDGLVLIVLLLFGRRQHENENLYQGVLMLWLAESLMMIGSAYGGYERFGYDFYQMAVGLNFIAWLLFTYKGTEHLWKENQVTVKK